MSLKNRDEHNRWRNKTVAFRVSPEEWNRIERFVTLDKSNGTEDEQVYEIGGITYARGLKV